MSDKILVAYHDLEGFCAEVYKRCGLKPEDADLAAAVLATADLRGIPSHGVARLRRYVDGLKTGQMLPDAPVRVVKETDSSVVVDAAGGMGAPASVRTMHQVITKAKRQGLASGCVFNSNHFGIAGYYALMAAEEDMIGIAMTNTAALGVPTFGRQVMFGTNPLAFCAPANRERAFLLDMSTTVVSRGKLEVYAAEGKELPLGWAVDRSGQSATAAKPVLDDMFHRRGGGILPLGGEGEQFGGYKGYGLAVMVDVLCAVLCGAPFGPDICDTELSSARVSHFFAAMRVDLFRSPVGFKDDMDKMMWQLRETPAAEGHSRVYVAGQKEFEHEELCKRQGVPLSRVTHGKLAAIAAEYGLRPPGSVGVQS